MDIFYDGTKACKKCKRELPNNSLHYPNDKNCKSGLRNVCRECNPKYKRFLKDGHRSNKKWSDDDIKKLKDVYKNYTNEEIIELFFKDRTLKSLESISYKYNFNHKTEETIKRGCRQGSIKNSQSRKGVSFSDEHIKNIGIAQKKRYEDKSQREIARKNAIARGFGKLENHPIHLNPLYGERNGRWKGGMSEFTEQLRRDIVDWKKESSSFCDYKCIFTGGRFDNIHHITSFNSIIDKSLDMLGFDKMPKVSGYTKDDYLSIRNTVIELHKNSFFGACLCSKLHELFHKEYSYFNSTVDDFIDFSNKVIDGCYDNYFIKNNLIKNINIDYIDYLKNTTFSEVGA